MATTFQSSKVSVSPGNYKTEQHKSAVEKLIGSRVEACDSYSDQVLQQPGYHSLVAAVDRAFQFHYPLALSPDMFWITIAQGLANHINLNAEELRSKFVSHQGKATIKVRRDDFLILSPENPWEEVFPVFSQEIQKHIGSETHSLILSDFSTTGKVEQAASEVVLMDAMQSYFNYLFQTCCGIPAITLEGTVEDWEKIVDKVQRISQYGLSWWTNSILPCLEEIVKTAKGESNQKFWEDIYKESEGSGGPFINGWLIKFLPYLKDYRTQLFHKKNSLCMSNLTAWRDYSNIGHDDLPSSASQVPFTWEYYDEVFKYQFVAGILGATQDSDTHTVRPRIGWAVREAPAS